MFFTRVGDLDLEVFILGTGSLFIIRIGDLDLEVFVLGRGSLFNFSVGDFDSSGDLDLSLDVSFAFGDGAFSDLFFVGFDALSSAFVFRAGSNASILDEIGADEAGTLEIILFQF